jgi:hypothetical protein
MPFKSLKISILLQKPILNLGNFSSAQNNLGPTRAFGALLETFGYFSKTGSWNFVKTGFEPVKPSR